MLTGVRVTPSARTAACKQISAFRPPDQSGLSNSARLRYFDPVRDRIRSKALALGFDDCGFTTADAPASAPAFQAWLSKDRHGEMAYMARSAEKRMNVQRVLPGARSVICVAVSYSPGPAPEREHSVFSVQCLEPVGLVARYARYTDYHAVLGEKLEELSAFVTELGGSDTRSLWYVDTGPILERDFAQRAGLGFIGKHTNLISRNLGNWIFLAQIVTTLEIEPETPETNRCGTCTRCIQSCPTAAITAPFQLDARRCISYLTIEVKGPIPVDLRPLIGNRIYGCDDCLAACPWNRFARHGRLMQTHHRTDLDTPGLLDLLSLDDAGFKQRFRGTPMERTKRRGLLRNVCVALGNTAGPDTLPGLERARQDKEPLVAEHAAWAIEQINSRTKPSRPLQ
jgi:epoxyqueuosine reductase